ncbi:uncharacterized protein LOC130380353 isoform X4 [Gadus chalcogrammus]|uniref:uncharacterized protein LOC130380353 isoform X4 n=1 Tax=Gadus chalcogrammus TaxID=1042646 RepID=UPI0024C41110|nr:uncharacterized protein LOC130380353 isoform X4 [Gadus chalcogrammus]
MSGLIETMEMIFLLLGFLFFVKGCTGLTLYGEVGGTAVFQCNSTMENINSIYFQGGPGFTDFIIGYHKTKNLTEPSRPDTYLNHVDKTVTFWNLTVSDEGTYKCVIDHGVGRGITEDTTTRLILIERPPTPSIKTQPLCNVSCALRCTADTTDLGPVSYEWKKDEGEWTEGDALKNISSSDTPEKFFCRLQTRVRTSNTSLPMENPLYKPVPDVGMIIGIIIAILCIFAPIAVMALVKCCPSNPLSMLILGNDFLRRRIFCNQQRPQSIPQADPVSATEEVAEREIFVPQPPVEDLEMETLNNTN